MLTFPYSIYLPVVLPRVSHLPPQSLMSINKSGVPVTLSASSSAPLSAGWDSMSHLTTTLLWKQWALPGLQSKQLAYSDVQQWHSHRLCYDVRQHHNISCRRTELNIFPTRSMGQSVLCVLGSELSTQCYYLYLTQNAIKNANNSRFKFSLDHSKLLLLPNNTYWEQRTQNVSRAVYNGHIQKHRECNRKFLRAEQFLTINFNFQYNFMFLKFFIWGQNFVSSTNIDTCD